MSKRITKGLLVFFSGKMGAGKSTQAREVARRRNAVLISEDEWLEAAYPGEIASLQDYVKYAGRLKPQIKRLVQSILVAGVDVVMDFPANTPSQRAWFREIFAGVHAPHDLIFIDTPDAVCLKRIDQRRNEHPERAATDTAEMFEQVTRYFAAPAPAEGFNVTRISATE